MVMRMRGSVFEYLNNTWDRTVVNGIDIIGSSTHELCGAATVHHDDVGVIDCEL